MFSQVYKPLYRGDNVPVYLQNLKYCIITPGKISNYNERDDRPKGHICKRRSVSGWFSGYPFNTVFREVHGRKMDEAWEENICSRIRII